MAYKFGKRDEIELFPASIEDYVGKDDPVRVYDALIEKIEIEELGIEINPKKVGNSQYDPRTMLKLLVYAYSYGWKSSRKIERALYHNVSFMWLVGGLKPDHKTISEFRRKNKKALSEVLKKVAYVCMRLGLIEGNIIFIDGTKIRGNASKGKKWSKKRAKEAIDVMDKRIKKILEDIDLIDKEEEGMGTMVKIQKELADVQKRKEVLEELLMEMEEEKGREINETDRDSVCVKIDGGTHPGYNVQTVTDDKHGFVISAEAVKEKNDMKQLSRQTKIAEGITGKKCEVVCADGGYDNSEDLAKLKEENKKVVIPIRETKRKDEKFRYDEVEDLYVCMRGKKLIRKGLSSNRKGIIYEVVSKNECVGCKYKKECSKVKKRRVSVYRHIHEDVREEIKKQKGKKWFQEIYSRRQYTIERVFGHIKGNLNFRSFLLRGLEGVQAEVGLVFSAYNIQRLIGIFGVQGLIETIANV